MNSMASLLVAKDLQQRRHAEATRLRRRAGSAQAETNAPRNGWISRLTTALSGRRWSPGRHWLPRRTGSALPVVRRG